VDLRHGDYLNERMGHSVKVEELSSGRILLRLGGVLFELDLFDADANMVSVLGCNAVMLKEIHVAVSRKWFCLTVRL
jgi:hypothetical protein